MCACGSVIHENSTRELQDSKVVASMCPSQGARWPQGMPCSQRPGDVLMYGEGLEMSFIHLGCVTAWAGGAAAELQLVFPVFVS